MTRSRPMPLLLAVIALLWISFSETQAQPEEPGPYQAGWTQQTIQRGSRTLNCRIYYPAFTEGSEAPIDTLHGLYPIVAFGHGFFMQTGYYLSHFRHLATHGYVVIAPQFPDTQHGELADDLLFCVDYIRQQHATPASRYFGLINTARVGLSGHSMGGGASLLAASRDSRVRVVAPLAAAETSPSAIAAMPLIAGFVYLITGGSDGITPPAQHQIPMYNNANPVKGLPIINGANHTRFMDFAGFDFTDPSGNLTRPEQLLITRRYMTSVFNLVLQQDPSYWVYAFGDSAVGDARLTFSWAGRALSPLPFSQIAPSGAIATLPVEFRWHRTTSLNPTEPVSYSIRVWDGLFGTTMYSGGGMTDTSVILAPSLWPQRTHRWEIRARTSDSTVTPSNAPLSFSLSNCLDPVGGVRMVVTDAGTDRDTIMFGFDSLATCGEDPHFCEYYPPAGFCGPPGFQLLCAYWHRPCTTGEPEVLLKRDIRRYRQAAAIDTHQLRFRPGDGGYPIKLRWSSVEVASMCDSAVLVDVFGGILHRVRMDLVDSLVVTHPGIYGLNVIRYGQRVNPVSVVGQEMVARTPYLSQNYPNPFNPTTVISFTIPRSSFTTLSVHDVLGREVAMLVNDIKQPGRHEVQWDAEGLSSGVYFYTLKTGDFIQTRKLILIR